MDTLLGIESTRDKSEEPRPQGHRHQKKATAPADRHSMTRGTRHAERTRVRVDQLTRRRRGSWLMTGEVAETRITIKRPAGDNLVRKTRDAAAGKAEAKGKVLTL